MGYDTEGHGIRSMYKNRRALGAIREISPEPWSLGLDTVFTHCSTYGAIAANRPQAILVTAESNAYSNTVILK